MKGINQVHFIGSVAKDVELKYTAGELAILELTVAGKEQVVGADGETRTAHFYNRCKAFGPYAEALAESFQAGDVVTILGRLDYRSYEKDGEKRSTVETVIASVQTLEGSFVTEDDKLGQPVLVDGLNSVTIGGNLTKDAELRYTPNGNAVTHLSVAVNEHFGKDQERVGFYNVQGWGELAEVLAAGSKGRGVIGVGRILSESWEDGDGNKRYGTRIELDRAHFVAGKQRQSAAKGQGQRTASPRTAPPQSVDQEFPPEEDLPF